MIATTHPGTGSRIADGVTRIGATEVVWRIGSIGRGAPRGEASRTAREWAGQLVTEHDLFPWRGLEPTGPHGKPRPVGTEDADLSIAHSAGTILIAACVGARVGADVESAPFAAFDSVSLRRRMCTRAEAIRADALPLPARRGYLARIWTAKEAILKATGAGLSVDPRTLSVDVALEASPHPFEAHLAVLAERTAPAIRRLTLQEQP